jgi:hypothetical protein
MRIFFGSHKAVAILGFTKHFRRVTELINFLRTGRYLISEINGFNLS